jgi:hypothetical protein
MAAALEEWPIRFAIRPMEGDGHPEVSFVIAHAGADRVPQLQRTLQSLFAQEAVRCEYIVVDQSQAPVLGRLPGDIVYKHLDKSQFPAGWRKSWALNVGSRIAQADILVFHDGDICAPAAYARELLRTLSTGQSGAASLQRMLFYLDRADTEGLGSHGRILSPATPSLVFQNWKGGTIAVRRDAFASIGGFDEGFVDWGGEDDEFYDRCADLRHCRAGYLPFVHLWHPPQAKRMEPDNVNTSRILPSRLAIPRKERIVELRMREWGNDKDPGLANRYE